MSSFLFTLRQKDPKVYTNGPFCCFSSVRGEIRYDHLKLFASFLDTPANVKRTEKFLTSLSSLFLLANTKFVNTNAIVKLSICSALFGTTLKRSFF